MTVDSVGNVYIYDTYNYRIRKVDLNGKITTVAGSNSTVFGGDNGPATSAGISQGYGVAVNSVGDIFISDRSYFRIRKVDHTTGYISTIAGTGVSGYSGDGGPAALAQLNQPNHIALDSAGNLYICEENRPCERNDPEAVAFDSSWNIFISDTSNCRIRKVR